MQMKKICWRTSTRLSEFVVLFLNVSLKRYGWRICIILMSFRTIDIVILRPSTYNRRNFVCILRRLMKYKIELILQSLFFWCYYPNTFIRWTYNFVIVCRYTHSVETTVQILSYGLFNSIQFYWSIRHVLFIQMIRNHSLSGGYGINLYAVLKHNNESSLAILNFITSAHEKTLIITHTNCWR